MMLMQPRPALNQPDSRPNHSPQTAQRPPAPTTVPRKSSLVLLSLSALHDGGGMDVDTACWPAGLRPAASLLATGGAMGLFRCSFSSPARSTLHPQHQLECRWVTAVNSASKSG
ncbi:hypothetical protein GGTG_10472 [Gaeumannomyces tritici R3-111a-1]|uniref:Uncharacterized protein n=1 Tax=Gaeumannomyces tritici (strain R3-111a-1) TaxID=644352 RepID=J3PAE6_GAET3|nr:hypothetical protein GGTG_10472 [Gaeumannomyces tritici R3-111a-1]EJT71212.1 hypothetical protein GGTG_10472 [Gaeumannomyces tritici R3-111a-1]